MKFSDHCFRHYVTWLIVKMGVNLATSELSFYLFVLSFLLFALLLVFYTVSYRNNLG